MRILTFSRSEWNGERYVTAEERGYEYEGPVALCDRSAHSRAQAAGNAAAQVGQQALGAANQYGSNASAVGSFLMPQEEQMALHPPGYADLPNMLGSAGAISAANANRAQQDATLRSMRTGNAAGAGAIDAASAQGASQAETGAIQNILAQNDILKAQQQEGALGALAGLYGTDVGAQMRGYDAATGAANAQSGAANAMTNADKAGWFQNYLALRNSMARSAAGGGGGNG